MNNLTSNVEHNLNYWIETQFKLGNLKISTFGKSTGEIVGKWKNKYKCKKYNAKDLGITFTLSLQEYLELASKANLISPEQIGRTNSSYQLARYKDLGGYTKDNCRFITQLDNIKERNEHFNISEVAKIKSRERVKNGTHNLIGLSKKRWEDNTHHFIGLAKKRVENGTHHFIGLAKKRVEDGSHNFLGVCPWDHPNTTSTSIEVWKMANECYDWWKSTNKGGIYMKSYFKFKSERACLSLILKFKSGWTPRSDKSWLEFK